MGKVVPGAGVRRGRERTGLGGAGRALGHGAVLLRGRTVVRVALADVDLLVAEVDAQDLPRRLPLAARHRALRERGEGSGGDGIGETYSLTSSWICFLRSSISLSSRLTGSPP